MPASRVRKPKPVAMWRVSRLWTVLRHSQARMPATRPTTTTCQTMPRKRSSDHDRRSGRFGGRRRFTSLTAASLIIRASRGVVKSIVASSSSSCNICFMNASPSPLERLRVALPDLPGRLQEAGRFIARNDFDATTRSMRDLAAAAGLQPASFTRLAQALGHTGWDDFREALIEAQRPAPAAPFSGRVKRAAKGASKGAARSQATDLCAEMLEADAQALTHLAASPIAAAAKALGGAKRIWVAGFRSCRAVAVLLHYQLRLF